MVLNNLFTSLNRIYLSSPILSALRIGLATLQGASLSSHHHEYRTILWFYYSDIQQRLNQITGRLIEIEHDDAHPLALRTLQEWH